MTEYYFRKVRDVSAEIDFLIIYSDKNGVIAELDERDIERLLKDWKEP